MANKMAVQRLAGGERWKNAGGKTAFLVAM